MGKKPKTCSPLDSRSSNDNMDTELYGIFSLQEIDAEFIQFEQRGLSSFDFEEQSGTVADEGSFASSDILLPSTTKLHSCSNCRRAKTACKGHRLQGKGCDRCSRLGLICNGSDSKA